MIQRVRTKKNVVATPYLICQTLNIYQEITGEFVDTSSEKVKYDFKDAEYNFRTTVKNITPKNQKHLK